MTESYWKWLKMSENVWKMAENGDNNDVDNDNDVDDEESNRRAL